MRAQSKNKQTAEARENAGDQFASGCGYSSDWLRRLHELSRPIYDKCFFCDKKEKNEKTISIIMSVITGGTTMIRN